MKKRFAMLLVLIMLLSLSACGGDTSSKQASSAHSKVKRPETSSTSDETASPSHENIIQFNPSATIEEPVLVDESDIKITATELKYTAYDVKLSLNIENNSNQDLSFYSGTLAYSCNSVNGYMVDDGYLNADVAAGKKANEAVSFSIEELSLLGFTDIADIEMGFIITDGSYSEYLQTGPRQLKTSIADSYNYETDTYRQAITSTGLSSALGLSLDFDSEEVVFDQKGVRVISQAMVSNSGAGQSLLIEVENTSSDMVYVSVGDIAVNGLGVQSGAWSIDWISAGKRRVIVVDLSSILDKSYQSVFGLEDIGQVTYSFELADNDFDTLVIPQQLTLAIPGGNTSYNASGEELYQTDGIHIVSKGLVPDSFEFSDDIHLLLLLENGSSEPLSFDVDYGSVSVNGYMTDFICYSKTAAPSGNAVLDVRLMGASLEGSGISKPEDITELELAFTIRNKNYIPVASSVVSFESKPPSKPEA